MSSVLVKGMEMPKSCSRCWFNNSSLSCAITGSCIDRDDENRERLDDCPLVALPDKHGDLIDRDVLKEDLRMGKECDKDCPTDWKACHYDRVYAKQDFCSWIDDADTIVEAEGEE